MLERFGKSFRDIADLKTAFFEENDKFLYRSLLYGRLYTQQPLRSRCKICDVRLPHSPSFTKHGVPYVVCSTCTQLNGMHEDTDEFCHAIYTSGGGQQYAENYSSADADAYRRRRERIYAPKAQFLIDTLKHLNEEPAALRYADMGAGAGYFVSAMREAGLSISGYEVGEAQVSLGNWIMPDKPLTLIDLHDTVKLCEELAVDVLTFIGVFEHVQQPREILSAIRRNSKVRYFYICVPMFGPCIYNEMAFPEVMPRQLANGHTHLFTDASIRYLENEFGLERVGAWWFGTDVMDYYRSVVVTLMQREETRAMAEPWRRMFEPLIDGMQLAIDKERASGQIHAVFKVDR